MESRWAMSQGQDWKEVFRNNYLSTHEGTWNWDHAAIRLFNRGTDLYWNPRKLDFTQDIED